MPSNLEDKKNYTIAFYNSELINHFLEEEEILFPLVKGRNSDVDNQMKVIIKEHKMMEKLISEIKDTNELEEKLDELGWLLEKHIRKEERELFTAIEKLLTENELSELESKLKQ